MPCKSFQRLAVRSIYYPLNATIVNEYHFRYWSVALFLGYLSRKPPFEGRNKDIVLFNVLSFHDVLPTFGTCNAFEFRLSLWSHYLLRKKCVLCGLKHVANKYEIGNVFHILLILLLRSESLKMLQSKLTLARSMWL